MKIRTRTPKPAETQELLKQVEGEKKAKAMEEIAFTLRTLVDYHKLRQLNVDVPAIDEIMSDLKKTHPDLSHEWDVLMDPFTYMPVNSLNVWMTVSETDRVLFCKFKFKTYDV